MTNSTDLSDYCTLEICPITEAYVYHIPSLAGNTFYLTLFAMLLAAQLVLTVRYRTWGYLAGLFGGLVLEIIKYIRHIQLHSNPFRFNPYLEYLICLTIGPAFLSAFIYIYLGRIVIVYGEGISYLRSKTDTIVFIACDLVSLILQAAGGAITSDGINIMIAGLASQVASLILFMALCLNYAWRVYKSPHALNPETRMRDLRHTLRWKAFLAGLALATVTIFVRSVFRVAELKGGFHSSLANNQVLFLTLEGAMVAIAVIALTTKWSFRRSRDSEMQLIKVNAGHEAKAQRVDSGMS
ncbi:RTA1 domain-containing protein [Aspergillus homomorphus CBS 101889]|uniref:RTA1-domain-containing protein n=1 Tax=Aspergillus homomorphus (strain CBS 101889) TaxID=1450537 RepID=A0A395ICB0_ASPHC|nr:RTA1-domain-containing protein [Aspergillus homomorphus CBS 101889]RAL17635.1 RTA1-domain-containing protein [Aspergillus homomorphus CBS 101889]